MSEWMNETTYLVVALFELKKETEKMRQKKQKQKQKQKQNKTIVNTSKKYK